MSLRSGELVRNLFDDSIRQGIGHVEDVFIDLVERTNVRFPVFVQQATTLRRLDEIDRDGDVFLQQSREWMNRASP